jgi:hypothetical protein
MTTNSNAGSSPVDRKVSRQSGFVLIEAVIVAAIVLILAAIVWDWQAESKRPNIEIKKDDWACTKQEVRTTLQPMPINNTVQLLPMTNTVCVEYRRHAG